LCKNNKLEKITNKLRDMEDKDLWVMKCLSCGFVFLSSHDFIIPRDISYIVERVRCSEDDDERRFQTLKYDLAGIRVLDFGCGNGNFLLKTKKIANEVIGIEMDERFYSTFEKAKLKVFPDLKSASVQNMDIITMFHVLEHLPNPRNILTELRDILKPGGKIIIEIPNSEDALSNLYKIKEYNTYMYWSFHLYYFNMQTLQTLVKQVGLKMNYIKQIQRYPLSNHLCWLSESLPNGHKKWNFLDSPELHAAYESSLRSIGMCDTLLGSFQK